MHSPMRVTASPPHLPMTITTNNSPESSTSEMSSCLVTREVPKDYLLDLEKDRVNVSHQNNYPNWATDKKYCMKSIKGLLDKSFIKAAQDRNFTYDQYDQAVLCTTCAGITKAWQQHPEREEDFAYICRGHFPTNWEIEMEKVVMIEMGVVYAVNASCTKKGCIARLCVKRRTEMVKNWNNLSQNIHSKRFHVTRPPEMIRDSI